MGRFARALFLSLLAIYLTIHTAVYPIFNSRNSFEPLFAYCRTFKSEGGRIGLVYPKERVSGAAVLYLGETVPELFQDEEVIAFLDAPERSVVVAHELSIQNVPDLDVLHKFTIGHDTMVVAARKLVNGE